MSIRRGAVPFRIFQFYNGLVFLKALHGRSGANLTERVPLSEDSRLNSGTEFCDCHGCERVLHCTGVDPAGWLSGRGEGGGVSVSKTIRGKVPLGMHKRRSLTLIDVESNIPGKKG